MAKFLHLSSTQSTNDDAYALARQGAEHGFGVLADIQLAGKGRLGKAWYSTPGTGLTCSIIVRPKLPFIEFPKLTLTAGLALCKALEGLFPALPFGLKWPNDLYCRGRKCGGILVEAAPPTHAGKEGFAVVGIGLNVNALLEDFAPELQCRATSLRILSGVSQDIESLYHRVHGSLLKCLGRHEDLGFADILREWRRRDILLGKTMKWLTSGRKVIVAQALGPDDNGQLLARDASGKVHEILSGDVQLAE